MSILTCGKSIVEALPSCENMSWSLFTNGMTASPKTGEAADAGDGGGALDGDPGTDVAGTVAAGCDISDKLPPSRVNKFVPPTPVLYLLLKIELTNEAW